MKPKLLFTTFHLKYSGITECGAGGPDHCGQLCVAHDGHPPGLHAQCHQVSTLCAHISKHMIIIIILRKFTISENMDLITVALSALVDPLLLILCNSSYRERLVRHYMINTD